MKSIIVLLILLVAVFFVPTPALEVVTTCTSETECVTDRNIVMGDSLYQMVVNKLVTIIDS